LKHADQYKKVYAGIQDLVTQGILVTGVPIKLQTLAEKRKIIKNFDQCVDAFNIWAKQHGIDQRYNDESLLQIGQQELAQWYEQAPENLRLK
jgi:hypothetical protein